MKRLSVIAAALTLAASANAATISFSDSFGASATNWNQNLSLQQFDNSLGTLNSVVFNYSGTVSSIFRIESLDAAPATVSANTNGSLIFGGPIGDTLTATASTAQNVSAFDGAIDFGGTSGAIIGPVSGSDSDVLTILSGLGAYIGAGTFSINVQANGLSNASGSGNLISQINTEALANIEVVYDYTVRQTQVPEPGSLALVGLALAGIGFAARYRKA